MLKGRFPATGVEGSAPVVPEQDAAPAFTIITPCLNRAALVAEAVESVLAQDGVTVEHIVVDGGSTDGTLEVLARYPHLRVLTGPDRGVYDAINRGLGIARGSVVGHLNSDDLLLPGALTAVARALATAPEADAACGGATVVETGSGLDGTERPREACGYDDPAMKRLRPFDLCRGVPMINARFFRRSLYERVGGYDPSYRYAGDREFLIRAWTAGMTTVPVAERVYLYRQHDGSMTIVGGMRHMVPWLDEHLRLARRVMDDPASSPALRREARDWHAFELGRAAARALTTGSAGQAARLAFAGIATDPIWPARFARQASGYCLRHYCLRRRERAKERPDTL
ncbi:glycosyltransferase family 2 protein [Azospirillum brasilense]|uniref:glycosyltransferase family 2 protein n=1 Tax=Azospirillum brasilense TaxID=192 RepID=UPI000E676CF3|nr:glycosyltransferase family 2 protein [Azospirillum brasilense]NUB24866.1 glycosyltransferase [Azospirillum brasilense]NUB32541.1 glycosyltransferase [Azospirillum brasilense]RIW02091.1 glycosyltransferase [Azospirillum brasilense]